MTRAYIWPDGKTTSSLNRTWLASLKDRNSGPFQSDVRMNCRMLAHNKLGPIREERTLMEALAEYERIEREDVPAMRLNEMARSSDKVMGEELESALSARNLALLGRILASACLKRRESRGAHFRLDYPDADHVRWRVVTRLQSGADGTIEFHTDPTKNPACPFRESQSARNDDAIRTRWVW
jgi:succinate dehydrogenase/fumarate reductase flavoprotein subunit